MKQPVFCLIVPCYNEAPVLPETGPRFIAKVRDLAASGVIAQESRVLFVDDGSSDTTWDIIRSYIDRGEPVCGIRQSRNRGHQNALLTGYQACAGQFDVTVTIDADGQDDLDAVDAMLAKFGCGYDVVYGVRKDRSTDTAFKKLTAEGFYHFMSAMGVDTVFNHADYRLLSDRALRAVLEFRDTALFWRGTVPLVGYPSCEVAYDRHERIAGKSHYPLRSMLRLATDGIVGMSVKPLGMILPLGAVVCGCSVLALVILAICGRAVGTAVLAFLMGLQTMCTGIVAVYVGRLGIEVRHHPGAVVMERLGSFPGREDTV